MRADLSIQNLLKKFVLNQCSKEEVDQVVAYIQEINDSSQLPLVEDVLAIIDDMPMLNDKDANRIYDDIIKIAGKTKKVQSKRVSHFWKYAAAASVLIIISLTLFLNKESKTEFVEPRIVNKRIEPGTDKAILTLEDGSEIRLEKGSAFQTRTVNSNGEELIYEADKTMRVEKVYNYLTIPRGGQFYVKLADGTQVWLNSESQLKYPVSFVKGKTREVELVYGEAYFDVSSSEKHQGARFKVLNKSQDIEVVGTEFNIKAYKDESHVYTTLVEGKVDVNFENKRQRLIPDQQMNLDTKTNVSIIRTVDVYNEISWKDGVFSFERKPLKDIMKVLSRWYDMDVIYENKSLEDVKFFGALGKDQNIEEILKTIKEFKIIESYEIKGKKIILK